MEGGGERGKEKGKGKKGRGRRRDGGRGGEQTKMADHTGGKRLLTMVDSCCQSHNMNLCLHL